LLNLFNSKKDFNPSVNKNAKLLVDLLIERFGVEESVIRIQSLYKTTNSSSLKLLLEDVLFLLSSFSN
jgi:phage gp29-like protein